MEDTNLGGKSTERVFYALQKGCPFYRKDAYAEHPSSYLLSNLVSHLNGNSDHF